MIHKFIATTFLSVICLASLAARGLAAEEPNAADLAAFVNDDTFFAVQIDVATLPKAKGDDGLLVLRAAVASRKPARC